MANTVQAKQALISWFITGRFPTEDEFNDLITSFKAPHKFTFQGSEIVDGELSVAYGTTTILVDGAEVSTDIEITKPLEAKVFYDGEQAESYPVIRVDDKNCRVIVGGPLTADNTYTCYIEYYE